MKQHRFLGLAIVAAVVLSAAPGAWAGDWPSWRGGVTGSGITAETDLPTEWGEQQNVKWRTPLPDRGNSTPIVLGERVFVTQAVDSENFRGLMCYDRADGKLLWKNGVTYKEPERTHRENPYCSASPVTDGERVVAHFGSAGVVCYDLEGNELWRRELGRINHTWGNSSSPVLYKDLCFVYHGPGNNNTALLALDKETGKTVWRFDEPRWDVSDRNDGFRGRDGRGVVGSFSTPILVDAGDRKELIMSFPNELRAFDPESGEQLWKARGLNPLIYTSPVFADGTVVTMGGYYGNSMAVEVGGSGDVTASKRLWHHERHHGGIGSGVVKNGYLYYPDDSGLAYCMNLETGKNVWKTRLPGRGATWGSFLLSGDRIYTLSQTGATTVFKATPEGFKQIARNNLGEKTNSTVVPSDGDLFIRTHEALWCISED